MKKKLDMQGIIAATKSSLMIENDLSLQLSDSESFDEMFNHVFGIQDHQSATMRGSTPFSDSSDFSDDHLPPSPIAFSPPGPDISFLSNCSTSSPAKSNAHEQVEACDILRSSTPERVHTMQEERISSQEISMLSHDEAFGHSQDQMSFSRATLSHPRKC